MLDGGYEQLPTHPATDQYQSRRSGVGSSHFRSLCRRRDTPGKPFRRLRGLKKDVIDAGGEAAYASYLSSVAHSAAAEVFANPTLTSNRICVERTQEARRRAALRSCCRRARHLSFVQVMTGKFIASDRALRFQHLGCMHDTHPPPARSSSSTYPSAKAGIGKSPSTSACDTHIACMWEDLDVKSTGVLLLLDSDGRRRSVTHERDAEVHEERPVGLDRQDNRIAALLQHSTCMARKLGRFKA